MLKSVLDRMCLLTVAACLAAPAFAQEDPAADQKAKAEQAEKEARAAQDEARAKADADAQASEKARQAAEQALKEARDAEQKAEAEFRKAQEASQQARRQAARAEAELLRSNLAVRRSPALNLGKWWIGVGCAPAPAVLARQLGLEEGGLVVDDVVAESPAQKAGIAKDDLLISIGDKKVQSLQDLMGAVQAAEGKEIAIKLYRGGKEQTLQVTPAERPKEQIAAFQEAHPGEFELFLQQPPEGGVHVIRPGVVFDEQNLPKELSISITRKDKESAKITVTVDGKTYEATEDDLQKLPDNVREQVRGLTARGYRRAVMGRMAQPNMAVTPWVQTLRGGRSVEQQLQELQQKIDALQKAVDALAGAKPNPDGGAK